MAKIAHTAAADEVLAMSQRTGFSRFPVIGEDADDIRGVVHVKQAFALDPESLRSTTVDELKADVLRVPESMGVDTLLGLLRRDGFQIAILNDEYGGTAGMVTLEDLVEELVGELRDEHDRAQLGLIRRGRSVTFDAGLRPDELQERTGIRVPDDHDYDTVGGYVIDELDRFAEVGDEVDLGGGVLRVERVDGGRVDRLRYTPDAEADHG